MHYGGHQSQKTLCVFFIPYDAVQHKAFGEDHNTWTFWCAFSSMLKLYSKKHWGTSQQICALWCCFSLKRHSFSTNYCKKKRIYVHCGAPKFCKRTHAHSIIPSDTEKHKTLHYTTTHMYIVVYFSLINRVRHISSSLLRTCSIQHCSTPQPWCIVVHFSPKK